MLNESIDKAISEANPTWAPGFIPEAAANFRVFLGEVSEVVARCSKGRLEPNQRFNRMEYHLLRVDGVRYKPISSDIRCGKRSIIFRAVFKDGRVAEAYTDGRERQYSVEEVRGMLGNFGKRVTWSDFDHHRERYFPPPPPKPTPADVSKQWE
ncbi:hypothetical protein ACLESD_21450 [Pyxidicoccus sp. 3LFB2]